MTQLAANEWATVQQGQQQAPAASNSSHSRRQMAVKSSSSSRAVVPADRAPLPCVCWLHTVECSSCVCVPYMRHVCCNESPVGVTHSSLGHCLLCFRKLYTSALSVVMTVLAGWLLVGCWAAAVLCSAWSPLQYCFCCAWHCLVFGETVGFLCVCAVTANSRSGWLLSKGLTKVYTAKGWLSP